MHWPRFSNNKAFAELEISTTYFSHLQFTNHVCRKELLEYKIVFFIYGIKQPPANMSFKGRDFLVFILIRRPSCRIVNFQHEIISVLKNNPIGEMFFSMKLAKRKRRKRDSAVTYRIASPIKYIALTDMKHIIQQLCRDVSDAQNFRFSFISLRFNMRIVIRIYTLSVILYF